MPRDGIPPACPLYWNDFVSDPDVEAMSTEAVGAFFLLLAKAWYQQPPATIPNDDAILARWARLDEVGWNRVRSQVLAAFKLNRDKTRWRQKRLAHEYAVMMERRKLMSEKGKGGASARWHRHGAGNARGQPGDSFSSSSSSSIPPPKPPASGGLNDARAAPRRRRPSKAEQQQQKNADLTERINDIPVIARTT